MRKRNTSKQGFTLIELLVTATIFALLIAIGMGSYINVSVALKKQNIQRQLYTDMETTLQDIHRWGKFYTIDYDWYNDPVNESIDVNGGNEELVLLSKSGDKKVHVKIIDDSGQKTLGIYKEKKDEDGDFVPEINFASNTFEPLTSPSLSIENSLFFIFPDRPNSGFQPKVTISLNGNAFNPFKADEEHFTIQTTLSIRPQ